MFLTGQKIVLVDDRWPKWVPAVYKQLPIKDQVYTVRKVCSRREDPLDKGSASYTIAVLLQEVHNPDDPTYKGTPSLELGFRAERFRPLEELTDDEIMKLGQGEEQKDFIGQPLVSHKAPELVPMN